MEVGVDGQYLIVRACCMVQTKGHGELVSWICEMVLFLVINGDWLLTWCMGAHKF